VDARVQTALKEMPLQELRRARWHSRREDQPILRARLARLGGAGRASLPYTAGVKIWLEVPDAVVGQLADEGQDLSRAALEALAIDAYRMERITGYQLCQLLEIPSRHDLDAFLKRHGVPLEYTIEDFEREGATSARLWDKRQAERPADLSRERRPE